jgi:4-hydroxybenzoate polyprenyltransferase
VDTGRSGRVALVNPAMRTALKLGRVSNLPTVWTNVLAGVVLNGAAPSFALVVPLGIAISLLYVAGMYLNDAFDRRWDAEHRPERPIPAGEVSARTVFVAGFGMMAAGLVTLLVSPGGTRAFVGGAVLAALIVLYDVSHKKNPFGPLLMGLCRVAVYVTAALAVSARFAPPVYVGGFLLLMYLITLSLIARDETKNARLPRLVGMLIAGISLLDGVQLAALGPAWAAAACVGAFLLTLLLQQRIAGT